MRITKRATIYAFFMLLAMCLVLVGRADTPVVVTIEALKEFETKKKSLESREKELEERKRQLDVQEQLINNKLKRIEELNGKMAERLEVFKQNSQEKVNKLVTVVETMKPAAAAQYIENVDPELAVQVLSRIDVAKAAKILNLVDKKKSARLTELFTGYRKSEGRTTSSADVKKESEGM